MAGRSRSKKNRKYLDGISSSSSSSYSLQCGLVLLGFLFYLRLILMRACVYGVMVSIILLPNLADVFSIYYHNLIFFLFFYSPTLLFERCLCLGAHFSALLSSISFPL